MIFSEEVLKPISRKILTILNDFTIKGLLFVRIFLKPRKDNLSEKKIFVKVRKSYKFRIVFLTRRQQQSIINLESNFLQIDKKERLIVLNETVLLVQKINVRNDEKKLMTIC